MMVYLGAAAFVAAVILHGIGEANPAVGRWLALSLFPFLALVEFTGFRRSDAWLLALFAWCGITLLWSPDPAAGAHEMAKFAALVGVFFWARDYRGDIPTLVVISVAAVFGYSFTHIHSGFGNENFEAEFILLALPFLFAGRVTLVAVPLALWVLWNNGSNATWAVAMAYGAFFVFSRVRAEMWPSLVGIGLLAVTLAFLAEAIPAGITHSVMARVELAYNTAVLWWMHPAGVGFGGFNYYYPEVQGIYAASHPDIVPVVNFAAQVAGKAHNEYLHLLVTGGPVALVLAAGWLLAIKPRNWPLWVILGAGVLGLFAFPMQNPATGLLVMSALGVTARHDR